MSYSLGDGVLRRATASVALHEVEHYVGPSIKAALDKIEELTVKLSSLSTDQEILSCYSELLILEKQLNTMLQVSKLSKIAYNNRLRS